MEAPAETTPQPSPDTTASTPRRTFSTWRTLQTVLSVAVLIATLFTIWTPASFLNNNLSEKMALMLQPGSAITPAAFYPTPTAHAKPRVGLVAGHWGNDSGAVCPDGLTEAEVNLRIATLVKQNLVGEGYDVDLLKEFDPNLFQYQALVLVSIHNDSCDYINDEATGFKVAAAVSNLYPEKSNKLVACMVDRYGKDTGLPFHFSSITRDMTEYHAFSEINSSTTAGIIETGFLNLDRQILTEKTDLVAKGVTDGILCFIRNEAVEPTPTPATP